MSDEGSPTIADGLVAYMAAREQYRGEEVRRRWDALSTRERRILREAAVMGYVQGVRAMPFGHEAVIPPDAEIVARVIDACLAFPDLYPTIDRAGSRRRPAVTEEER